MKTFFFLIAIINSLSTLAQTDTLKPRVYSWNKLEVLKDSSRDRAQVLDGSTWDLANLEIHVSTLEPGKAPHPPHTHADAEELVIIKEGTLRVTINGQSKLLPAGSIAVAIP